MKNKSKKPLIFISIVVFLLITGVFYFSYTEIEKKNNKAEKTINQWQAEDLRRKEIETIIKSVQAIKDDNEVIKTHFAQSSDLVPFLDTIDGFAPKVGAENEITSVDITQDTKELIVGMKVIGSFEAVYRFVTLLENSPYEIEFVSTDIQKVTTENSSGNGSAVFVGIKSEKTGKVYPWEGIIKIKLLSFIP